jgi:toxin ParE1/3/4
MIDVVLRHAAERDIAGAFDHYLKEAGGKVATAFVFAANAALAHISEYPSTGSPRYGQLLDIPGLRSWLVRTFPYTFFYVVHEKHLDVIRLLHQNTDIPAQLQIDLPDSG